VDLGKRRLRVAKAGYKEAVIELEVNGSGVVSSTVSLEPIVHAGTVVVQTQHDGAIAVDGKLMALERWKGLLPSGQHSLRVSAPGKTPYQSDLVVEDNQ